MISEILAWWLRQMRALVATSIGRLASAPGNGLLIETLGAPDATPPCVALGQQRGGAAPDRFVLDDAGIIRLRTALGARRTPRSVVLRLPPAALLEREVVLPLLAEHEAERALQYEMDRLTPFDASELFWTWSVVQRDRARGRLCLRLSLVPRALLAPLTAALQRAGITPTSLEAAAADGTPRLIALRHARPEQDRWRRRGFVAAAATCVALACAAVALPFLRQSMDCAGVEQRIADLQPRVAQVETLRRRIAGRAADTDVVAAEHRRVGDALRVLAEITDILPDDTSLTDFTMRQGRLELGGQSAAAARLIASLSSGPAVHNPIFAAPVTRGERGDTDIFSIRAEVTR